MFSGRQILKNTLLLTAAALLLRFASMLFQAHLAGRIGAEGLGTVQLLLSVSAFATTLGLAGMRVAASCLCAQAHGKREPEQVQLARRALPRLCACNQHTCGGRALLCCAASGGTHSA